MLHALNAGVPYSNQTGKDEDMIFTFTTFVILKPTESNESTYLKSHSPMASYFSHYSLDRYLKLTSRTY